MTRAVMPAGLCVPGCVCRVACRVACAGGKIWEMRCYLAEHAMSWERGVTISAAGTAHCHGIKMTSAKG